MSFERVGPGADGPTDPVGAVTTDPPPPTLRLQVLSTEHWSLLASRSLAWNESFSRVGMFLTTLSGAMVALALVAQASTFGNEFFLFALIVLPIVLFVGVSTVLRLATANYHDALCVVGMNRIRGAYLELVPDLEQYFVMSAHDDFRGVGITMGVPPEGQQFAHLLSGAPTLVIIINALLVGVITTLVVLQFASAGGLAIAGGVAGFLLALALQVWYGLLNIRHGQAGLRPLFPSPPSP